ncbi:uncharacterized protein BO97DRAFT_79711 [Aspergillus homomorphus CBS 101889]|uniref:Uncharacterized protein n=1 Tax=Aspergillus homomorphus (strain CBS 101889) TaxID=1450537 RepID=A0A395ICR7_ASPHC|nr:hypothetical protein BO97DRAFT_79711 [Aspergillus homomorphus CBS 101889]RAL16943.1 hypothetical protein BO97DRAFT_79711 [Aspergillus homomorphus CBS 101889]
MSTNPFISHSIPTAKQDTPATPAMSPHGSLTGSPMGSSTRPAWIRQPPELEDYWNELYSAPSSTTSTPTHRHNRESFTMASPTATARARRSGEIRHGKRPIGGRPLPSPAVTDIDRPANDAGANHPMSSELIPKPEPQRKRARFVRFQDEVTPQSAVGSGSAGFNFGYSGSAVGEVEKANGSPIGVGSSASASASGSGDKQGEGSAGVNGDLIDKESDAQRDELQWIYQCHLHDQEERQRMEHEKAHDKAQNEALFNALANALNHCSGDLSKEDEDVDMEDEDVEMQ